MGFVTINNIYVYVFIDKVHWYIQKNSYSLIKAWSKKHSFIWIQVFWQIGDMPHLKCALTKLVFIDSRYAFSPQFTQIPNFKSSKAQKNTECYGMPLITWTQSEYLPFISILCSVANFFFIQQRTLLPIPQASGLAATLE